MALRARAVLCVLAAAVGCGGSPEPAAEVTQPVTATPAPAAEATPASAAEATPEPAAEATPPLTSTPAQAPGTERHPRCGASDASAPPAAPAGASAEPSAPEPTQTCWCFAWVHGPDHGNDCFLARAACTRNRRERGPSGETRACERTQQRRCERTGYHDGRLHNLGPTRPRAQQILGKTLAQLRRDLGAPTGREAGWHRFGLHLAIQVVDGRAHRVRLRVDEGTSCAEVVRAEGFPEAGAPLRRASGCEWPGISERHRLDEHGRVAGRLDRATSTLEVWLRR